MIAVRNRIHQRLLCTLGAPPPVARHGWKGVGRRRRRCCVRPLRQAAEDVSEKDRSTRQPREEAARMIDADPTEVLLERPATDSVHRQEKTAAASHAQPPPLPETLARTTAPHPCPSALAPSPPPSAGYPRGQHPMRLVQVRHPLSSCYVVRRSLPRQNIRCGRAPLVRSRPPRLIGHRAPRRTAAPPIRCAPDCRAALPLPTPPSRSTSETTHAATRQRQRRLVLFRGWTTLEPRSASAVSDPSRASTNIARLAALCALRT
ncbi:hypothetical protein AB1Y20_018901 [Prymnesium parvum]|uniref:Uncharacterized protein n=1 Tax=Prymnesium parvum TaxID=97485 RepID=A0AB34JQ13_PRYPA